jgi:hypothetical protein
LNSCSPFLLSFFPLGKDVFTRITTSITHVERTSGANQNFTFLSTPEVANIKAGTPPEEMAVM